jgi:hypothetical protein
MGRAILLFRIELEMEEEREWKKPFRNALDKSDKKKFLMKCLTFLDYTFQHVLILSSISDFIPFLCL